MTPPILPKVNEFPIAKFSTEVILRYAIVMLVLRMNKDNIPHDIGELCKIDTLL